jgi:hypothetical protein
MASARTVVRALHEAARQLAEAAHWRGSGLAVDAHKANYVFELLCYFTMSLEAGRHYSLTIEGTKRLRNGRQQARWPRSHGLKRSFSYIRLTSGSGTATGFQLCPGIDIEDKHRKARAPDINLLQEHAPMAPTHQDLLGCWDAKYSATPSAPLRDEAVSDFVYTHQQLGSPNPPTAWTAAVTKTPFSRSGILTNAQHSSEPNAALAGNNIAETSNFPVAPMTRP